MTRDRREEYEGRKEEFESYVHFLNWKAEHSEIAEAIREKVRRAARGAPRDA